MKRQQPMEAWMMRMIQRVGERLPSRLGWPGEHASTLTLGEPLGEGEA
jgi:hypothetical protein